jgi:hypothetical protein
MLLQRAAIRASGACDFIQRAAGRLAISSVNSTTLKQARSAGEFGRP